MNKNELCIAAILERCEFPNIENELYLASRLLVGYMIDKETFVDALTGQKYMDLSIAMVHSLNEGFEIIKPVKAFRGLKREKYLGREIRKYWNKYVDKMVYVLDAEEGRILCTSIETLEDKIGEKLGILYTKDFNSLHDKLINGEITVEEYEKALYCENEEENDEEEILNITNKPISEVCENIKKRVISQDEAIKKLVVSIYKNAMFPEMKSNVLLYGPTGVGKTELLRSIAKELDIPVSIEDMTRYTEAGYVGASPDDILVNLINNADGDVKKAERSILFLDEIDKKASSDRTNLDFNKGDLLKSLLKIIEGDKFDLKVGNSIITFDTSKLIVVAGGAFSELFEESVTKVVGFEKTNTTKTAKDITIEDLEKYGMPIEFLGRFKTIIKMNSLNEKDFVNILKNSELSSLNRYVNLFKEKGVNLVIPESIYEKIANLAIKYKTGARALNIVVDNIFESILFEIFENMDDIDEIVLGEKIYEDKNDFILKRKVKSNG